MHKSKNIVHINTKAKRSQTSCFQEVWPFYSLTSVKDGIIQEKLGMSNRTCKSSQIFKVPIFPIVLRNIFLAGRVFEPGSLTLCLPLDFHNPLHYSPLRLIFLSNFCFFLCTLLYSCGIIDIYIYISYRRIYCYVYMYNR